MALALCSIGLTTVVLAEEEPTQAEFALSLVQRLGLGPVVDSGQAMEILSARGIEPDEGWYPAGPASALFIVQLQKDFHTLLLNVADDVSAAPPPTLSIQILTTGPLGPQTIYFPYREVQRLQPPAGLAGRAEPEAPQGAMTTLATRDGASASPSAGPEAGDPPQASKQAALASSPSAAGPPERLKVGETLPVRIETPHPYPTTGPDAPIVWRYAFTHPNATFIRLRFRSLLLAEEDYLVLRDEAGEQKVRLTDGAPDGFWSQSIDGDTVVLELHSEGDSSAFGLVVDRYGYGFPTE